MKAPDAPIIRYKGSEAQLVAHCKLARRYLLRDIADLTPKGITPEVVASFAALTNDFAQLHSDSWWVAETSKAVAERNAKRHEIMIKVEELRGICKIALPQEVYAGFRFDNLRLALEKEYAARIETIIMNVAANLAALEPQGITAVWLAELTALKEQFVALRESVYAAEHERTIRRTERVVAGNELWDTLKNLCRTAILYYNRRDPATARSYKKVIATRKPRKAKKSADDADEPAE